MATPPVEMSKRSLAEKCFVSCETVRYWCNVLYYEKLCEMGYRKHQKVFTPKQWHFLNDQLVIVD